ncbi:MAG TPA: hypothetical protein VFZ34_22490 [Blastocatellia bacterium]|nr:hypothetical protein [Blastocatellia bacterium]
MTNPLTLERFQPMARLYHEAVAVPAAQREQWLAQVCSDDPALRSA